MTITEQWHTFTSAPHRVMFLGGALQSIAVMLWLLVEMAGRYGVDWPCVGLASRARSA